MNNFILKLSIVIAIAFYGVGQSAHAQQNVKGMGWSTCEDFQESAQGASTEEESKMTISLLSWFQGYATGKNLDRPPETQKNLQNLIPSMIFQQVENYCRANDSTQLYEIAETIYESLPPMPIGNS